MTSYITELPSGYYQEHQIKKKNGKIRKIVAPSSELLSYQQDIKPYIDFIFHEHAHKSNTSHIFHGFIHGKNCVTACNTHAELDFDIMIQMDISNFFDTVNRNMISQFDKTLSQDDNLFHKDGYTAQGFATSPTLANLAIIPAVQEIDAFLQKQYQDNYRFTIYADDIAISLKLGRKQAHTQYKLIKNQIQKILLSHQFSINARKTRIRYTKYGWIKLLGINIKPGEIRASRAIMRRIRAARHQKNIPSLGGLSNWASCNPPRKQQINF